MRSARWIASAAVLSCSGILPPAIGWAQGSPADYARAELFRALGPEGLVIDASGQAFVLVDATTLTKGPAFDHERLGAALTTAMGKPITAVNLPFRRFTFTDSGRSIEFTEGSGRPGPAADDSSLVRWRCTLTEYVCDTARGRPDSTARERRVFGGGLFGARRPAVNRAQRSPDGKWEASIRNYNVYVRPTGGGEGVLLSTDGSEGDSYDPESITWSPDSRHLAAYRVRPGYQREVHYVASSPDDQLQPRYSTMLYNKPGDVLDRDTPVLFDVAAHTETIIDNTLFPNAYNMTRIEWRHDGCTATTASRGK